MYVAEYLGNEVPDGYVDHQDNVLHLAHQTSELHVYEILSKRTSSEAEKSALQRNIGHSSSDSDGAAWIACLHTFLTE